MGAPHLARNGLHDFDFLIGHWRIENKRLVKRLQGSNEWETFHADLRVRPLPGGIGNVDEFIPTGWRPGYVGMSLRVFNPETRLWSIYWLNNENGGLNGATGLLLPPVVGKFQGNVGRFEGPDQVDGRPVISRFNWIVASNDKANWEQTFSADGGKTWEPNWLMEITRAAD